MFRSEINSAIEELSLLAIVKPGGNHETAHIPTKPFLSLCYMVLQVLDKIGPTMAVLRQDVHQNIKSTINYRLVLLISMSLQRLEMMHELNPSMNSNLVEILNSDASKGNTRKKFSCSKAFLWLTRSLDFSSALLQALEIDPKRNMEQIVQESYDATLSPWHGWISSAAFRVAIKLVPDSKTFMDLLKERDENFDSLKKQMQILVSLLVPFLEDAHCILKVYNLDRIKST
ncbi:hypothetical protein ACSQ67_019165 [Phaseolus vulgaris]